MADENYKRKLTAILSADVAGYSRLMGDDEVSTVSTLKSHRNLITEKVQSFNGRVVDSPGDNILSEFRSIVDAVSCALAIQQALKEKNDALPENRKMLFRIGVNLGDVIQDEDRIYGDGVNIAARIEGLADPGGIAISGTAFDNIRNKLDCGYHFSGEHPVKNIANPVRVYKILTNPECAGKVIGEKRFLGWMSRKVAMASILSLAIATSGLVSYYIYLHQSGRIEPASIDKMVFPLPDKPSIAVLPFDNLSVDPNQDYFSDGLTEDIITTLSKVPKLFVISRNSTFTYKNKSVKVQQVAEDLGVRYVLEGSVRKEGEKIRITTQLIDAVKGHHLWAERYDRDLKDIFALQDEIAMKVLTALDVKLVGGNASLFISKSTDNLEAYLKVLQKREFYERSNREGIFLARQKFEEALALDPNYAAALNLLARTHFMDVWLGSSASPKTSLMTAIALTQKAIALDNSLADSHALLGYLYTLTRQHDKAIAQGKLALQHDPNSSTAYLWLGASLQYAGIMEEAVVMVEKGIRLNPMPPSSWYVFLGSALFNAGRYDAAMNAAHKAVELSPNNIFAHLLLVLTYSMADRGEKARHAAAEVLRIQPNFTVESFANRLPYKDPVNVERMVKLWRNAGLPG
jgi:adenylate cyclase